MPQIPEEAFRRIDETPDEEFYRTPRLLTHIDDRTIAAVTQLYRELFPALPRRSRRLPQRPRS